MSRKRRTTAKSEEIHTVLDFLETDTDTNNKWENFKLKSYFVEDLTWNEVIAAVKNAAAIVVPLNTEIEESQSEDISPVML